MRFPYRWKTKWLELLIKLRRFRKKTNLRLQFIQDDLFDIDEVLRPYFRAFSALLMVFATFSLLIPVSFHLSEEHLRLNNKIEVGLLIGFLASSVVKLIITSDRKNYLRKRWFEMVFSVFSFFFLIDNAISKVPVFEFLFSVSGSTESHFLRILKGYLILIVIIKAVQYLPELLSRQSNSARFMVNSFLFLITAGTILLMLPGTTVDNQGLDFIDALFTATSAVCVTGLIVVDTATHFTLYGQVIILSLIQLGGLGIITFATFILLFISGGLGVRQLSTLKDLVSEDNTSLAVNTLKRIVGFTLFAEIIGMGLYYIFWTTEFPDNGQRLLFSVFHSISAFCNAGFSLFTNSLADSQNALNPGINLTTVVLIVLGGLGFTVEWELIHRYTNKKYRRRKLSVHSKLVLVTTASLIAFGMGSYLILEWNNTLQGMSVIDKLMVSLFQSVTTRTAGFNSVDIGSIGIPATLVIISLMVIGGSPASTAGGVKTTTFAILFRSIIMTIRGNDRMEIYKRTIPNTIIFRAITVLLLAGGFIAVSTILLSIFEDQSFIDLLFEEVSAIATVGLSRGITSELSSWGKAIITLSMFMGRVGVLTFMVAFAKRVDIQKYQYPEENIMVS